MAETSVIIPTYNEAKNIRELILRIDKVLEDYQVVVVDDDSPDKTWKRAEELSDRYPVEVIRRTKEKGLATAVIRGIKETDSEVVAVMDADLQHPPEKLDDLVNAIKEGNDLAIGSRFVEGGSVENWSRLRLFISKLGKSVAKTLFPIVRKIKDPMTGFFAVRRDSLDVEKLDPVGFKILLEILVMNEPESIKEVPIKFKNRSYGSSGLDLRTNFQYVLHNLSLFLRSGELYRFLRFALVGTSGIGVDTAILFSLSEFIGIHKIISKFFAVQGAILSNFTWNNLWTFKDKESSKEKSLIKKLFQFELASLGGKVVNIVVFSLLINFTGLYYLVANIIAIFVASVVNYLSYNHWVWFKE